MINTQLSVLIELAKEDGQIHPKELDLIKRIGVAHGLDEAEVENIISQANPIDFDEINKKDRFEMLMSVVELMKADGQIFDEEIRYCMDIATRMGFPLEAVMELYAVVHTNLKIPDQLAKVRKRFCS